jgi:hypothetical protein
MTKRITHRFKLPGVIALALAMVVSSQTAKAAVDSRITTNAAQDAQNAEIERVGQVAIDYAALMGSGTIKLSTSNVKALANILASEIQAKSPGPTDVGPNRLSNKADEIAEAAALIANGIASSPKFKKGSNGYVLNLMKGAVQTAKKNTALLGNATPSLFADVAGSVMLTLINNTSVDAKTDKKLFSFLSRSSGKIAGAKKAKEIKLALKEAYKNPALANVKYEDGTLGLIIDPETDTRNG